MVTYIMGYIVGRVDADVNRKLVVWLSALPLCLEGFSMPLGGFLAQRVGYRIVVGTSCVLVSGGILLTNFTIQKSFFGVVMTYSMIIGLGLGLGYSVSLAAATSVSLDFSITFYGNRISVTEC
ncbi:uncharacterized protein DEA37_0013714 [Paragonimus westermani]|uniref:Major facilitator superfamily (MFS) profile domain-containing protein n=1 Tax=Paragonimus westermani TaxID=34504 RepID=A0A5J4N7A7_9TREM|nr:uncharacterized protein DEA37_0013714 [Paragonimus westermani]